MEIKQAIEVIKQGLNIATGAGAFKSTQDVAIINTALEALTRFEQSLDIPEVPGPEIKTKK